MSGAPTRMSPTPRSPGADTQFARLREEDVGEVLALQEANLHDNLLPAQRSHGFLIRALPRGSTR